MSVYETEISVTARDATGAGLGAIASSLLGLKGQAGEVETALGRIGGPNGPLSAIMTGMKALVEFELGVKMAKSLDTWINKAQELSRIHNEMKQIGFGAQIADFDEQSRKLSQQYRNLSITEIQKGMREAIPIFGDATKAGNEFGPVAEFMSTMKAKFGAEHGGEINRQVQAAVKAAEESGAMKPDDVGAFLKNEQKMLFAFGDQVSPSSMLTVQRNLGAYQKDLDDHFRFGILPAMAINQGQRAGTEIATTASKFVAGIRNSSTALDTMLDLGIVKEDDLEYNDKHIPLRIKMGHKTSLADDMDKDPLLAVTKDLLPLILEKYGNDPLVMRQAIARLAGDKTAISGITDLALNAARYEKDAANVERVDPNFDRYRQESGDFAKQSIEAQKENLQVALGMPATGPMREAMTLFAKAESAIADAALRHPDITAFGTAMTGVGSIALEALGSITGALLAARLLGVGGGAVTAGGVTGTLGAALGWLGKGGSPLKGGLLGGAIYGAGSWGIDKLVPWLGGHSEEEHERLQKQGPAHFWSGIIGDANASELPRGNLPANDPGEDRLTRARASDADPWFKELQQKEEESVWRFGQLNSQTGVLNAAFVQLGQGGGSATGNLASLAQAAGAAAGALRAMIGMGGGAEPSIGGAGGITNASYTTWDSPGRVGRSPGAGSVGGNTGHVDPTLLAMVHRASEIAGVPLSIVSGYRSPEDNMRTGGAAHSLHMRGWASDLSSPGHSKGDGAFWAGINHAMGQAAAEMHQPYRWGGLFPGRYARDNNHFDLTSRGPVHAPALPRTPPQTHQHNITVQLDSDVVGRAAVRSIVASNMHPRSVGSVDARGFYAGPGMNLPDSA